MKKSLLLAFLLYVPASFAQPMLAVSSYYDNLVNLYTIKGVVPMLVKTLDVGKAPTAMCLDPNGSRVFVSITGDKRVAAIDFEKQSVVATFSAPAIQRPDGCVVSPDSKKVYVADMKADSVFVFSTESNQLLKQIPVGKEPTRVIFSPDGKRLVVANADSNNLSVIDAASDSVVQTVKTGHEPHAMTYTRDGKFLIVTLIDDDSIAFFKADTMEFDQQVGVPQSPQSVICSPDGQFAYVLGRWAGLLGVVNLRNYGETRRIGGTVSFPVYPLEMDMRSNGNYMYIGTGTLNNALVVIDLPMRNIVFDMHLNYQPWGVIFRP